MGVIAPRRAAYRVRQFFAALNAYLAPLPAADRAEAHALLPAAARSLFDAMPRNDQRHSLQVARTLRAGGHDEPALLQAALLHDAAKAAGGVTLLHRVAVVLLKAFWPRWLAGWEGRSAPPRRDLRHPFWAHANHPAAGAEMAAAAGCDPVAVLLIRRHQEIEHPAPKIADADRPDWPDSERSATDSKDPEPQSRGAAASHSGENSQSLSPLVDRLLAALQAADDDN